MNWKFSVSVRLLIVLGKGVWLVIKKSELLFNI